MKESDATLTSSIKTWMLTHGYAGKDIKITAIPALSLNTPTSGGRVSKGDMTIQFFTKDKIDPNGLFVPQTVAYKNVPASQIRAMVGIRSMLSYLVTNITNTSDSISVSGLGDGHGAGLSQWGAKNRADAGQKYNEILAFYYDGTTLTKEYSERPPTLVPPSPEPSIPDTIAPKISAVKVNIDNTNNKASISFNTDEKAKISIYIKDSTGKILTYLVQNVSTEQGTTTKEYNTSSLPNGKYYVGIIAIDDSNNQASTLPSFEVKRIVPVKDTTAPKLNGIKVSVDNNTNKATLTLSTNETSKLTVLIKDSKGKILTYLKKDALTNAGALTLAYSTTPFTNGKYTVEMNVVDLSNNKSSAAASFEVKKLKTGKVVVSVLHVRTAASSKAKIIALINKNQTVTILSTSGAWNKISYGKVTGYVPSSAVK